jgi:enoyl-CoA hydratase/carnithine racemase
MPDLPVNERVRCEIMAPGIARVTLTRADKLNALDPAMFDALIAAGQAMHHVAGLRCVVLAGEGKGFCAGLDLGAMAALVGGEAGRLTDRTHGAGNLFQHAALVWRGLPVPVVAAIHGVCFGGGLQIATGADIRVAAPDARLAVMEMKWGIIPDMAGFALWRGLVRDDVLRELTYTNREFSGVEAVELGFATLADPDPLARAMGIAGEIAQRNPDAIRAAKALFNRHREMGTEAVLMEESIAQARLLGSRNQMEAVNSQMERRAARFSDS